MAYNSGRRPREGEPPRSPPRDRPDGRRRYSQSSLKYVAPNNARTSTGRVSFSHPLETLPNRRPSEPRIEAGMSRRPNPCTCSASVEADCDQEETIRGDVSENMDSSFERVSRMEEGRMSRPSARTELPRLRTEEAIYDEDEPSRRSCGHVERLRRPYALNCHIVRSQVPPPHLSLTAPAPIQLALPSSPTISPAGSPLSLTSPYSAHRSLTSPAGMPVDLIKSIEETIASLDLADMEQEDGSDVKHTGAQSFRSAGARDARDKRSRKDSMGRLERMQKLHKSLVKTERELRCGQRDQAASGPLKRIGKLISLAEDEMEELED